MVRILIIGLNENIGFWNILDFEQKISENLKKNEIFAK